MKLKRKWLIVCFNPQGEVVGPVWEMESLIFPTRWANQALKDWKDTVYKIKEVADFSEDGYSDSFLKAV